MELSVIIVNYNVRDSLKQCLTSVIKASERITCEIIVVDNNSSDGSCSMVSRLFPEVKIISNNYNAGFARACNQALNVSSGEFVLLLNPDTIVEGNTLTGCLEFMRTHEDAGAMGVKMFNGKGRYLRESKRSFPDPATAFYKMSGLSWLFPQSHLFSRYYKENLSTDQTGLIEVLPGAFMFIRKSILAETGLLDEDFFMYGEDIDLSIRILNAGHKIYYYPGLSITHFKGRSSGKRPLTTTIYFYRAMLIFAQKYFRKNNFPLFYYILKFAIVLRGTASLTKVAIIRLIRLITSFFCGRCKQTEAPR